MKYFYGIIRDTSSEMPLGVRATWIKNGKANSVELTGITNRIQELSNFVESLNRCNVDVCHLTELTEDFLARVYSPEDTFTATENPVVAGEQYFHHTFRCFCEDKSTEEYLPPAIQDFSVLAN